MRKNSFAVRAVDSWNELQGKIEHRTFKKKETLMVKNQNFWFSNH